MIIVIFSKSKKLSFGPKLWKYIYQWQFIKKGKNAKSNKANLNLGETLDFMQPYNFPHLYIR